jgi:predicted metal-dependent phosphotriesterase family hydrolase
MECVMTVTGAVMSHDLGMTLMHEHVFINILAERRPEGLLNDYQLMRQELDAFAAVGGQTIVDLTTAELTSGAAPDPAGALGGASSSGYPENGSRSLHHVLSLQRISVDTGLNIVVGTGHYRDPFLDNAWFDRTSVDRIAGQMVRDIREGLAGTGVRAGIIGEIGADKWYLSAAEERSFRAAGRAHAETGLTITTHAAKWPVGIVQLDVLTAEGVDPARVIVGHCDTVNIPDYHQEIARRGAYVQLDNIRRGNDYDFGLRVGFVMALVRSGHLDQILLSQDVCKRSHLNINGGGGYDFVPGTFAAALIEAGLDQGEINHILVDNPRHALTGVR